MKRTLMSLAAVLVTGVTLGEGQIKPWKITPDMFPFTISYDAKPNAANVSHLIEAPAGKHGFVRVQGDHFATDAGPIRFHATNLTGPANFPSHADADRLAARLARLGINCVRHHFMDTWYVNFMPRTQGILADDTVTQRKLDPAQLDKFDYLVAALKKRGIYSNLNLHVGRTLDGRDGCPAGGPWANKTVGHYMPRMVELQKEYASDLLNHVNPYTGHALKDEPSIAMIEISNEDHFLRPFLNGPAFPPAFRDELTRQWNVWLAKRYATGEEIANAWKIGPKNIRAALGQGFKSHKVRAFRKGDAVEKKRDWMRFLLDTDTAYWTGLCRHIHETVGARQPVSGTQVNWSTQIVQSKLDYVDAHAYWRHPSGGQPAAWIKADSKAKWSVLGDSMVNGLGNALNLSSLRVRTQPYTVSEYNHPPPNPYGAEGQPILAAFAAYQNWSGIFQYSYNHYPNEYAPQGNPWCIFDSIARTDVLAHFPACAAMFLRGDVPAATGGVVQPVTYDATVELLMKGQQQFRSLPCTNALFQAIGTDVTAKPATTWGKATPAPFIWDQSIPGKATFAVDTPNTKLFTGFPEGRTVKLGGVTLQVGKTSLNWATVSLVSRNATGFGEKGAASILVAATAASGNADQEVIAVGEKGLALKNHGKGPVVAEGVPLTLELPAPAARVTCWALAPDGERRAQVPVFGTDRARLALGPQYRTVWYEVDVK